MPYSNEKHPTDSIAPEESAGPFNPASKSAGTKWSVFAAAAGAALAMASSAEAGIIYTHPGSPVTVSLAPGTGSAYAKQNFAVGGAPPWVELWRNNGWQGQATIASGYNVLPDIAFARGNQGLAVNFASGQPIAGNFGQSAAMIQVTHSGSFRGNFAFGQSGFVGFAFVNGSHNADLGWIRLKVLGTGGVPSEIEVIDWAYNDVARNLPGGSITAGEGAGSATPEPSTGALALLATGAAGLLAWRRRRAAALRV
jgi:hypothetical protein